MVAEIGIHDDYKVARHELQAMDIGGAQAELAGAGLEYDVRGISFHELVRHNLGAVRGAVVNDDDFPVKFAGCRPKNALANVLFSDGLESQGTEIILLGEGLIEQPSNNWQVATFVVGR